jgi:hypothetical protein
MRAQPKGQHSSTVYMQYRTYQEGGEEMKNKSEIALIHLRSISNVLYCTALYEL